MQDRYAGDVGDFGKFAILRALAKGRTLGVCWYRWSGKGEQNNDGKHTKYEELRHLDAEAYEALQVVVQNGRSLDALEKCGLLDGARYHGNLVPQDREARQTWFEGLVRNVDDCDLVFTDPDNGFETRELSPKHVAWEEVRGLRRRGRTLLMYHHQTRRKGGAKAEFEHIAARLLEVGARSVEAVRLRPRSPRFYFLIDADNALSKSLREFARCWGDRADLFETG